MNPFVKLLCSNVSTILNRMYITLVPILSPNMEGKSDYVVDMDDTRNDAQHLESYGVRSLEEVIKLLYISSSCSCAFLLLPHVCMGRRC
jgi:hypothetical protein